MSGIWGRKEEVQRLEKAEIMHLAAWQKHGMCDTRLATSHFSAGP